jgi:hypothetical protein
MTKKMKEIEMGIKNLFWKIVRNGKPAPYQHGPAAVIRNEKNNKWTTYSPEKLSSGKCPVGGDANLLASSDGCKCGGNCQCKRGASDEKTSEAIAKIIEQEFGKPVATTEMKTNKEFVKDVETVKPVVAKTKTATPAKPKAATPAKKPVAKVTEKKVAIAKDLADEPVVAKKPAAKKSAPKK